LTRNAKQAGDGRGGAKRQAPELHAVILAGGRGTRFWPRSRRRRAKQVLSVVGDHTLIQQTQERLAPLIPAGRVWVITNEYLRDQIVAQLPGVPAAQIIAEPAQRNTAPAIGLAARLVADRAGRQALMGIFPADHIVTRQAAFIRVVKAAAAGAAAGSLVVLGIRPRWPETGYGYVEFSGAGPVRSGRLQAVARFCEKPDLATARCFVESGRHFWNSGMFFWSAETILSTLEACLPKTAAVLSEIAADFRPRAFRRLYPQCENISIDYAVMEKVPPGGIAGVPCDIGWSDVGSWNAVYDLLPHDEAGNALRGSAFLLDARGNYLDLTDAPGKLLAAIGVEDLIVVDSGDALLIARRDRAQDVSKVVKWLEKRKREELL
jgi:mannose-1-phosphate guanylyltransferase